jgi:hypothetical protein
MQNSSMITLCDTLMRCDTEEAVIETLKRAGFWDDPTVWRFFDDNPGNYSSIGNQQSSADAALTEKLVNSLDARLTNECLVAGIRPDGSSAPQTIREAVAVFFEGHNVPVPTFSGLIRDWGNAKRLEVANGITLSATGSRSNPSFSIADIGEGQTPNRMPRTFLSLSDSNKMSIPFVQGRFQMGGTGALQFCGHHNLQLVISKRNPQIISRLGDPRDDSNVLWGFTIVRREDPEGNRRNSVYKYLVPEKTES